MTEPPPRKRFAIHIPIATVMVVVAVALGCVCVSVQHVQALYSVMQGQSNITSVPGGVTEPEFLSGQHGGDGWSGSRDFDYGWPYRALHLLVAVKVKRNGDTEFEKVDALTADTDEQVLFNGRRR